MAMNSIGPLPDIFLPTGVRSRIVENVNGLQMHILEAGEAAGPAGTLLLLHGFPELAFCWRRVMPLLAERGYRVIAPDQRGYGRTTPYPVSYDDAVEPYSLLNLAGDMVALLGALGLDGVDAVIGHDFGSLVAGTCALVRPDLFRRLALLGTPFAGAPALGTPLGAPLADDPIHAQLLALAAPRKHYLLYYAGPEANDDMWKCPQGVSAMLRGYYHHKSADWPDNHPHPLGGWSAEQLALMPSYYIMPANRTMGEIAAAHMPSERSGRKVHMAERGRPGGCSGRIRADRLSGRHAMVSKRDAWRHGARPGIIRRPPGSVSSAVRRWRGRLGGISGARSDRSDECAPHPETDIAPFCIRRRALAPAGATRVGGRYAGRLPGRCGHKLTGPPGTVSSTQ